MKKNRSEKTACEEATSPRVLQHSRGRTTAIAETLRTEKEVGRNLERENRGNKTGMGDEAREISRAGVGYLSGKLFGIASRDDEGSRVGNERGASYCSAFRFSAPYFPVKHKHRGILNKRKTCLRAYTQNTVRESFHSEARTETPREKPAIRS